MHVHETVVDHPAQAQPGERHQPWCDLRQHALARAEAMGPSGCVGRYVSSGGVGGWIAEDAQEPGTGARIVLDWRPAEGWSSLRPDEVEQLSGLLDRLLAAAAGTGRLGTGRAAVRPRAAAPGLSARPEDQAERARDGSGRSSRRNWRAADRPARLAPMVLAEGP